jgi:hypothetical protein
MKNYTNCKQNFTINIARYFTDVNGTIINKTTLPAYFQLKFPLFLLGFFDLISGYAKSIINYPSLTGSVYLCSFVYGVNVPFLQITGFNTVKNQCKIGDIVTVYVDDIDNPNVYAWIIQSVPNASLYSLIFALENITLESINMVADSNGQTIEQILQLFFDKSGNIQTIPYLNEANKSPFFKDNNFTQMIFNRELSNMFGLATYFLFESEKISLTLNLKTL